MTYNRRMLAPLHRTYQDKASEKEAQDKTRSKQIVKDITETGLSSLLTQAHRIR